MASKKEDDEIIFATYTNEEEDYSREAQMKENYESKQGYYKKLLDDFTREFEKSKIKRGFRFKENDNE